MFGFGLLNSVWHVFKFRRISLIFIDDFLCSAHPWAFTEDIFYVFCIDDFT